MSLRILEKKERVFLIIIIYIIYYIYNYDSIFSTPKTLMTLMTNDIDDINDIQRYNIGIGNCLTIHHVRNTAGGRSWQSGSFKAGKHRFHNGKPGVSWQESLSA